MTRILPSFALDNTGIPWELECALGVIRSDMTLMADCSTAQMMPALIGSSRPSVMFLSDLYQRIYGTIDWKSDKANLPDTSTMIEVILSAYSNDNKRILKPNTIRELDDLLHVISV